MVEQYLNEHPKTIVVNIACGMDTRCYRMKGKYLRWYNVDLAETMEIRSRFLTENGPIYQIAKSAMNASYIDEITYQGENVLVVIEGLSMYLNDADIKQIFSIIGKAFPKVTVMIETMSPFVVQHVKKNLSRVVMPNLLGELKMEKNCNNVFLILYIRKRLVW